MNPGSGPGLRRYETHCEAGAVQHRWGWRVRPSAPKQLLRARGGGLSRDCCCAFLYSSPHQWASQPWTQPTALSSPRMGTVHSGSWQSLVRPLCWCMVNPCCCPSPGSRAATATGSTAFARVFFKRFSLSLPSATCVGSFLALWFMLFVFCSRFGDGTSPVNILGSPEVTIFPGRFSALVLPRRKGKEMLLLWQTHAK